MEIKIVIENTKSEYKVVSENAISFVDVMNQLGIIFYRPCGGKERCMACGIRFAYGAPDINSADEVAFGYSELKNGWRLGCKCVIKNDCCIQVPASLVGNIETVGASSASDSSANINGNENLLLAVDIGTTTIAGALVDMTTGKIIADDTCVNGQLRYGADVVSRIESAITGNGGLLKESVIADIEQLSRSLLGEKYKTVKRVYSANTVMTHLFLGYPVDGLASAPFKPYSLEAYTQKADGCESFVFPGISAFVGGDVVAGLYYIHDEFVNGKNLFIDLGTNAEIVLSDEGKFYATSASAGPALEGGNLRCGMPSVVGAINHVTIEDGKCNVSTIGNASPKGLCGSGVIDLIYELRKAGYIDEGGLLVDEFADEGFIVSKGISISGEDIQQVLLAKSAICAGIQILLDEAGVKADQIDRIYIAGGLGAAVRPAAIAGIGLIPKSLEPKVNSISNSSLLGAIKYASEEKEEIINDIVNNTTVIDLANHKLFENLFFENLFINT